MPIERRGFLAGLATSALSVGMASCSRQTTPGRVDDHADPNPDGSVASGDHQQGVTSRPSSAAALVSLDLVTTGRDQIVRLLHLLTSRARSSEQASWPRGVVTVTLAVGAGLFRAQLGLSELRPSRLIAMPRFPNDAPVPSWSHGDLLLQVGTQHPGTAQAELRRLLRSTGALLRPRWSIHGNPDPRDQALMDRLVWVQPDGGEPAWTVGGTYQVVRLIRFATKLWDAEPVEHQEDVFGRHKQSGAPLAGKRENQAPNFAADPDGRITPLDAHIRRANPRTPKTEANRILRRSYSYRRGSDGAGRPDEGLIFICFQQDLEGGFATIQRRLRGEALEKYVLPFGGGYFFVLPAAPPGGYLGQQLLEAAK
jgi:deferrochelatase/peroxidase EfeB